MSKLNHEKDFRTALEQIIDLTELPMSYSSDFVRGQIRSAAQVALANADAADKTITPNYIVDTTSPKCCIGASKRA